MSFNDCITFAVQNLDYLDGPLDYLKLTVTNEAVKLCGLDSDAPASADWD
jgi:hypothetical protein